MTGEQRQAILFRVYDLTTSLTATATTYATLLIALQAITEATVTITATGQVQTTAGNGHTVTFFAPGQGISGPDDFTENAGLLRKTYVEAKADLITAGTPSPTDAQIWTEMYFRMEPVRSIRKDFSLMNCR